MPTRRQFLAVSGGVALTGCTALPGGGSGGGGYGGGGSGDGGGDVATVTGTVSGSLAVSTPAFEDGGTIPERYTGVGEDVSPPLRVESTPARAETLAVVVDDPDAPTESPFVHWLLWNVPAGTDTVPAGIPQQETIPSLDGARQGTNGFDELGYRGPLPPKDDGPHTYRFTTYAVGAGLSTEAGARRDALESALDGRVLDAHRFTGEFER